MGELKEYNFRDPNLSLEENERIAGNIQEHFELKKAQQKPVEVKAETALEFRTHLEEVIQKDYLSVVDSPKIDDKLVDALADQCVKGMVPFWEKNRDLTYFTLSNMSQDKSSARKRRFANRVLAGLEDYGRNESRAA